MYEVFLCALLLVEFYINDNLHYIFIFDRYNRRFFSA